MVKVCSNCSKPNTKEFFSKDKKSSDGLASWCRPCHTGATKAWKAKNKQHISEYIHKYSRSLKGRFATSIKTAKYRNLSWELSFEEFSELVSDECFYCNGFLGSSKNTGCGLDRVDNNLGYEYDNVVPCCKNCNKIKNNFLSMEETLMAVAAILEVRTKQMDICMIQEKGA